MSDSDMVGRTGKRTQNGSTPTHNGAPRAWRYTSASIPPASRWPSTLASTWTGICDQNYLSGIHSDHTLYCCNNSLYLDTKYDYELFRSTTVPYPTADGAPLGEEHALRDKLRRTQSGLGGAQTSMAHLSSRNVNDPRRGTMWHFIVKVFTLENIS